MFYDLVWKRYGGFPVARGIHRTLAYDKKPGNGARQSGAPSKEQADTRRYKFSLNISRIAFSSWLPRMSVVPSGSMSMTVGVA